MDPSTDKLIDYIYRYHRQLSAAEQRELALMIYWHSPKAALEIHESTDGLRITLDDLPGPLIVQAHAYVLGKQNRRRPTHKV
jgi:hypothetical protein